MSNVYSLLNPYPLDRKVVKKLMIDLDFKVGDLVNRLPAISQATISRYIGGVGRNPKIQQAIADVLGVPLDSLLAKPAKEKANGATRSFSSSTQENSL